MLVSRLWLLAATLVAGQIRHPAILSFPLAAPLWRTWVRWDAPIYARIALSGYQPAARHETPAFFPLWPLVERLAAPLVGGDPALAGLIVANLAFGVALVELYRLAREELGVAAARSATLALTAYPLALFGAVGYPESLFLALAIAAYRRMRRGEWATAALLGGLAALTRQSGVALALPFLWEYGRQRGWRPRQWRADLAWGLAIPGGVALFALWLWRAVGDPLAFLHAQATWRRSFAWPWQTLLWGALAIPWQPSGYFRFRAAQEWLTALATGALAAGGRRWLPGSATAFALALWTLFLLEPARPWPMLSQGRFDLEVFPVLLVVGQWAGANPWRRGLIVVAGVPLQLIFMGIFARGGWMI